MPLWAELIESEGDIILEMTLDHMDARCPNVFFDGNPVHFAGIGFLPGLYAFWIRIGSSKMSC